MTLFHYIFFAKLDFFRDLTNEWRIFGRRRRTIPTMFCILEKVTIFVPLIIHFYR
jgi:hypothetical protein